MDVLHVVLRLAGTTIPVDIASAIAGLSGVNVRILSERALPDRLPDTIDEAHLLTDESGFRSYRTMLDDLAEGFDVVHTHHLGPAARTGVNALGRPVRHVTTQHGHLHFSGTEKLKNLPGLLFADTIVYNSRSTAGSYSSLERLCKLQADEHVVHNGVDLERLAPFHATVADPTTVVTAARLIPRKNIGMLIRSLVLAEQLSLTVVGDGPARDDLQQVAQEHGVAPRVTFAGYLPDRRQVYETMADADVFALPSHGEGFCVAVAEAMAIGLPVVVSDIEVFHEVVGESGVFVDRTSPASIAAALTDLRQDPDLARRLGKRNRKRIRERFTLGKCARGYRRVYGDILK